MAAQGSPGTGHSEPPVIFWFRQDLRLEDNPGLRAACASGRPLLAVYILDDETPGAWRMGGAARWWLHHSLKALGRELDKHGQRLLLRSGKAAEIVMRLVEATGAPAVYWNRCYEPYARQRDEQLKKQLKARGVEVRSFNASLLYEPWEILTDQGTPFRVYTAFWKRAQTRGQAPRSETAPRISANRPAVKSERLESWGLLPHKPNWAAGFEPLWRPGEQGAQQRLEQFLREAANDYREARDFPAQAKTSRLSPHLHFGEIGPRQIWHAVQEAVEQGQVQKAAAAKFLAELGWREFSYHLLYHFPSLPEEPLRPEFAHFPWRKSEQDLKRWQHGETGYPLVDAGMRELWRTGWMHNRVRMVVASFLVKDLLLAWQLGEAWFWDTLVDADLANNAASWQWVAGCGADAAPYFRIFNPVLQGEKFDPDGEYVRQWVPELAALPPEYIHKPWEAPREALEKAGVVLGKTYPQPMVDHAIARQRALEAFAQLKELRQAEAVQTRRADERQ